MSSVLTITGLSGLTLISAAGSVWSVLELQRRVLRKGAMEDHRTERHSVSTSQGREITAPTGEKSRRLNRADAPWRVDAAIAAVTLGSVGLFVYRWLAVTGDWQPLAAHVDGLLLMSALLGIGVWWLHSRPKMRAITAFTLPTLTLVLGWGICAAVWTYRPFAIDTLEPVWRAVHLACVYTGTVGAMVAASGGAMYLWVERRIKRKQDVQDLGRFASLETLERVVRNAASVGFALLSIGLATGVVLIAEEPGALGEAWYVSPKVWLSALAWLAFAIVMSVRHATSFRGSRAAWLSIGGFVLLLGVYGIVTAMPAATQGGVG
jgi:hypothetical protein